MEKILNKAFINVTTMLIERGVEIEDTSNKYIIGTDLNGMKVYVYFTDNLLNDKSSVENMLGITNNSLTISKKNGLIYMVDKKNELKFKFILINYDQDWQLQKKHAFEIAYEHEANYDSNICHEYFEMRKISINLMNHELQPKYRLIKYSSNEYTKIHEDNLTSNKLFNKICLDDPVVKWIDGRPKDIIEITRKDTLTYRSIQDKSINLYVAK